MRPTDRERVGSCLENHRNPRRTRSPRDPPLGVDRIGFLEKLPSAQASRPFTHGRYAPPTNCHPLTRLSCTRARPFPRESRSDHRLSTDDFPTRCAFAFPSWPEEPAFSRRWPRFSGSVQSAAGSSPAVTRCEPTSGVPVAAAPSTQSPHWFAVSPLVGSRLLRVSSAESASASAP